MGYKRRKKNMKTNKNKTQNYYGIFYKSRGEWTGPWSQELFTKEEVKTELPLVSRSLKSKVVARKLKFV